MKFEATIVETPTLKNGYFWVVQTSDGRTFHLRGPGAPKTGEVGDKGVVEYRSGSNYGIYCWDLGSL